MVTGLTVQAGSQRRRYRLPRPSVFSTGVTLCSPARLWGPARLPIPPSLRRLPSSLVARPSLLPPQSRRRRAPPARSCHALREAVAGCGAVDRLNVIGTKARRARRAQPVGHGGEEPGLGGGIGAGERPGDERPLARPGARQALAFQVAVRLEHRIRVDGQLRDDLLGRRQLVTWFEEAELQGVMDLLDQLEIGGHARSGIELELDHFPSSTNWLVG